jgi:hypothetical protein
MPIEFHCPNLQCGRLLRAAEGQEGLRFRCPACGAAVVVPHSPELEAAEPAWRALAGRLATPRVGLIAGGVVVAAALCVGLVLLLGGGSSRDDSTSESTGGPGGAAAVGGPPMPSARPSSYDGPKLTIRVLFTPGRYVQTETQTEVGTQTVRAGSQSQTIETDSTSLVTGDVLIQPPDLDTGERHIFYTCTRVKMDMEQNGQRMSFDSEGGRNYGPLADALEPIVGRRLTQVVSREGKFLRLEGLEELLGQVGAGAGGPQLVAMVRKMLEPLLKELLTRHWGKLLPTEPVAPGDEWRRRIDLENFPMFGRLPFDFAVRFQDVETRGGSKLAVFDCVGEASTYLHELDLEALNLPVSARAQAEELKIRTKFAAEFDLGLGLTTSVKGSSTVKGKLAIEVPGGPPVKSTLDQRVTFGFTLAPR